MEITQTSSTTRSSSWEIVLLVLVKARAVPCHPISEPKAMQLQGHLGISTSCKPVVPVAGAKHHWRGGHGCQRLMLRPVRRLKPRLERPGHLVAAGGGHLPNDLERVGAARNLLHGLLVERGRTRPPPNMKKTVSDGAYVPLLVHREQLQGRDQRRQQKRHRAIIVNVRCGVPTSARRA